MKKLISLITILTILLVTQLDITNTYASENEKLPEPFSIKIEG